MLELLGVITGIIYLWLEYRANIYLWVAGIIMPAIYIFVYYDAGLYADFGINIYYLVIALYGWFAWKTGFTLSGRRKKQSSRQPEKLSRLRHTPMKRLNLKTLLSLKKPRNISRKTGAKMYRRKKAAFPSYFQASQAQTMSRVRTGSAR